ncbi:MAG: hypothetical protein Q7U91_05130 [Sideroxyarcus sp.]|nr:hypothetical protein [Sideroxyarcus sp.]
MQAGCSRFLHFRFAGGSFIRAVTRFKEFWLDVSILPKGGA